MTVPHCIRLQGPWQVIPPGGDAATMPIDIRIPATWQSLFGDIAGTAIFQRRFNIPTQLEEQDRVLIRVPDDAGEISRCSLNGIALSPCEADPQTFEITAHLREYNHLEIQLTFIPTDKTQETRELWKPVLLEIHASTSRSQHQST